MLSMFVSWKAGKTAFALHWYVWAIPHVLVRTTQGEHLLARAACSISTQQSLCKPVFAEQSDALSTHLVFFHLATAFQDFNTGAAEHVSTWCTDMSIHNRLVTGIAHEFCKAEAATGENVHHTGGEVNG